MSESKEKYVAPSVTETAFNCPHCGALTTQTWFKLYGEEVEGKRRLPFRITPEMLDELKVDEGEEAPEKIRDWAKRVSTGLPLLYREQKGSYVYSDLYNVHAARCFNCKELSLWVDTNPIWPVRGEAPKANPDLPADVRLDYEEASRILNLSPRGAAALLRLAIQKLCKELGGKGKKIDDDIAALVKEGLDVRIQRALDIVRVIGNNAVHPGQVDLRDDRATAEKLFGLVNIIADRMITQPKDIDALYADLPESSLKAIKIRDAASDG